MTGNDWRRNEEYDAYLQVNEEMLAKTDTDFAPWTIVEATDKRYAAVKIYKTVIKALEAAVERSRRKKKKLGLDEKAGRVCIEIKADLSLSYTREEYEKKKKKLQKELNKTSWGVVPQKNSDDPRNLKGGRRRKGRCHQEADSGT